MQTWVPLAEDRSQFQNETGLYDPGTRSVVKVRRSGAIDLFTGQNEGLRIDPVQHQIALLTQRLVGHTASLELYAQQSVSLEAVQQLILKSQDSAVMEAAGTLTLKADRIVLTAERISLNSAALDGALRELPPHSHHGDD